MSEYRAAIIGCGKIGSEFDATLDKGMAFSHAGAYTLHPKTVLVAAADSDADKSAAFRKKWQVDAVYADYQEMLKKERIDILSVCTPPQTHWPIVRQAAKFPLKAIYCEKPIAEGVPHAEKMVRICKGKNILLMVNHQRRFYPFYRELKQKILTGVFGQIQQVNCYYTRGIYNTGVHILDIFSFLFGRVEWVAAAFSKNASPFKGDPNLDCTLKFKNGPAVTMKACNDAYYLLLEIDVLGSSGRLRFGNAVEYFSAEKAKNLINKRQLAPAGLPLKAPYGPISLVYGVSHIINCLENRETPLSPGENAAVSIGLIEKLISSAKNNKRLFV